MGTREMWREYVAFLKKNVPASFANLAPGATDETIARLEKKVGVIFPESVKTVWRLNDGQKKTMLADQAATATPCLPTLSFLSTKAVARVWKEWDDLRNEVGEEGLENLHAATSSAVPGVVKPLYTSPKWIPLWADPSRADYVGLDLDPDADGLVGQIINFGRDENDHFQLASDFDDLLELLIEEIRAGNWEADVIEDGKNEVPWFGNPEESFFNTLHARWEKRSKKAKKTTASKKATSKPKEAPPIVLPPPGPSKLGTHVVPDELKKALAPLTDALIAQLEIGAGKHRRAIFHIEIERQTRSLEVGAISGVLSSDDDEMENESAPFAYGHTYQPVLDKVIKATDKIDPLYMIDYRFETGPSGWTHVSTLQTIKDRQTLDRERKSLDAQLLALLAGYPEPDTETVSYTRDSNEPLTVILRSKSRSVTRPPVSPTDSALMSAYDAFYRERGFGLFRLVARVRAQRLSRLELTTSYGVPDAS